jgi:antibiotic biosynthesis monooxygenase (ABM) superfamily enzyme
MQPQPPDNEPATINILRTVREGQEPQFEAKVRAFVKEALTFPGHLGVHVLKPSPGAGREYRVVLRFASRAQWREFQAWPPYEAFRADIQPLLEREPCVEELSGLESWFTLPGAVAIRPLPRWKMACVTLLGVYPTSLAFTVLLGPLTTGWPLMARSLAVSPCARSSR